MAASSASIVIPSDTHTVAATVSPRGVDLEDRLDLSLDALIKERRKEHKLLKKQEEAKKQKQEIKDKRKTPKQQRQKEKQQQTTTVKNNQKAQRKALLNKNRRLSAPSDPAKVTKAQGKTKTSTAAAATKLREEKQAQKSKNSYGRRVVSPKAKTKNNHVNAPQQTKKKNVFQQTRMVTSPVQPTGRKKAQILKQQPKTQTKVSPSVRQVMHSKNKKIKLSVTITGQTGKKKSQKKKNKVLLPGKVSQALAKKTSAAKAVVKRAKNRKATAKNTQVVRKVSGQRVKKN
ncbi:hypothetical protein DVH05_025086 [Phytophthora capsici]|nr:hypothetical protein DVH05_025086 [Phytophthora capsici]|eukprot:jgi/Phyca11/505945/fgenesh2_kg.PHYCAscaffold_17_\